MFGGNSNWHEPIWMPVNAMIIHGLVHYFADYGKNFKIECPTGSGELMNLFEVAHEIQSPDPHLPARRSRLAADIRWERKISARSQLAGHLLFCEYFHGNNGAGISASHQTGWTGVVAGLIEIFGKLNAQTFRQAGVQAGREAAFGREKERV
jgi:hypothetical protein